MKAMKNTRCDTVEHLIVDALFGEIDASSRTHLDAHLDTCTACSQMFVEMQSTLQVTREVADVQPPESYWAGFQQRLEDRIESEHQRTSLFTPGIWRSLLSRFPVPVSSPRFTLAYQLALALILVLVGVFIGRYGLTGSTHAIELTENENMVSGTGAMQVAAKTESYLNRSSVLLLGLVNHDIEEDGNTILNFDRKQEVAGTLVEEAALLKASLNRSEEAQLLMLIEELEKILLQIANLEMQEDVPGIELIQQGIEGRALLLKINLETMKLMDRPASEPTNELTL